MRIGTEEKEVEGLSVWLHEYWKGIIDCKDYGCSTTRVIDTKTARKGVWMNKKGAASLGGAQSKSLLRES